MWRTPCNNRIARFFKFYNQRRNERRLVAYGRHRTTKLKRLAMSACVFISALYLLELAAVIASVSTWCPTTSRPCN